MNVTLRDNKIHVIHNLVSDPRVFVGYLGEYMIPEDILKRLSKELGFSYDLYETIYKKDPVLADSLVVSMCDQHARQEVVFLVDVENKLVVDYIFSDGRVPILNIDFLKRVESLVGTSSEIEIDEVYYHPEEKLSSVLIKRVDPVIIEEKYENKDSNIIKYDIGILLVNDEINSVYSRLALYVDGEPLYLPASYYNSTNTRYKKSTASSVEALEVLMLKIIEDLRENTLYNKLYDLHFRYRANKYILSSYEEYNTLLRTMRKIPTIVEDNSVLEKLLSQYENFEQKYSNLDDQKSSYIWRCTALSDITVGALISITTKILSDLKAPPMEYYNIRELLGGYISTHRIADEIAREDIR